MRYFEMLVAIDGNWARYLVIPARGNRQALRRAASVMRAEHDDKPLKLVEVIDPAADVPSIAAMALEVETRKPKRKR